MASWIGILVENIGSCFRPRDPEREAEERQRLWELGEPERRRRQKEDAEAQRLKQEAERQAAEVERQRLWELGESERRRQRQEAEAARQRQEVERQRQESERQRLWDLGEPERRRQRQEAEAARLRQEAERQRQETERRRQEVERQRLRALEEERLAREAALEEERLAREAALLQARIIKVQLDSLRLQRDFYCPLCRGTVPSTPDFQDHMLRAHNIESKLVRCFGKFRCVGREGKCRNYWESAWVWGLKNVSPLFPTQVYTQQCQKCSKPTFAFEIDELKCSNCGKYVSDCKCPRKRKDTEENDRPHKEDLCQRCQFLGSPCSQKLRERKR